MNRLIAQLPRATVALLLAFLALVLMRGQSDTTQLLIASSFVMFGCCWASAAHLLGARPALNFVLIGVTVGYITEELGSTLGWFFGEYDYTKVLGPELGTVPIVIPLMWFALTYVAYVISNLIVWHKPSDGTISLGNSVVMSLLAAMIVTAYDLGADPYMVYVLKAWVMVKTDGWWFGETLQGFFGWMFTSFVIIFLFRLTLLKYPARAMLPVKRRHIMVPLVIYGGNMAFQMAFGYPVETRTIAFFAMGIPLLTALCGFVRWQAPE